MLMYAPSADAHGLGSAAHVGGRSHAWAHVRWRTGTAQRKHIGLQPTIQYKTPNDIDDTLSFGSLKGRVQRCLAGSSGASTCA